MNQTPSADTGFQIWWQLMRPHTLTAAFVPVFLGTALALAHTDLHVPLFLAMLIASLLIQAATNMFNEYFDFKRGLDTEKSIGIGGAIVRNGVKPKTVLYMAFAFFGIALLLGLYICTASSWWIGLIGIICMAVGYLYTGGPLPIAYTPFGELASGVFMGGIIIYISFYIQTGFLSTTAILFSIPIILLVGSINLSNNIRDRVGDSEAGRKTMAILIGHERSVFVLAASFFIAFLWVIVLLFTNSGSPWLFLSYLSIPKAIKAVKGFKGKGGEPPFQMMPAMKATAQTNTFYGFLLAFGLCISYLF
ncbi:1,4-dihydroxy-2-naphthoate polyprenyltransferase [Domibacillus sp. DTU_2020_1001157_1_SI_ALB_TIR_016]|uniref:1,4-dihydroxy-2-naphthoate polyprenyltransferase n=1 Tax=Domibacillus sp. DTU_2020_1001157_1_SI_ALB_TIR_016 TaxID=3077789 RepID=UPI0028EF9651|nr:1,4-dihydroxy-2-naphthoate polyprenyltransferase [Domibacillus sp. DTU_2020_1001157_1_SI_ALB_TIR_016]WNS81665.1 1,4-dihydroxy-2-naphthoate polyprenyltransferase [Domibacillus sp. DTU_2020_1001157_1_SI_ALB_TIR_016]